MPLEIRSLLAGEFTDLGAVGITAIDLSSTAWGDYDNDGDLDILVTGGEGTYHDRNAKVYRNNGDNTFSNISASLIGVYSGSAVWGDYDNDGDLDILLAGGASRYNLISKIYRNNGNSTFSDINVSLPGVSDSAVAWGDADNDGDLDLLLTGMANNGTITQVYRNDGNGAFTDLNAGLAGVKNGSVAWGDCDHDGDLDILLAGQARDFTAIARVYRNNGNSTFTDVNAGLTGVQNGTARWGDVDNDGDLDILLNGIDTGNAARTLIYRNDGNCTFSNLNAGLTGVRHGTAAWGDADNDGDLDVLLTGFDSGNMPVATVYRNQGNNTFTDLNAGLTGVGFSSVAWGDADRDGDLDILLTGRGTSEFTQVTKVYRNNAATANTPPLVPTGLTASVASSITLTFSWTGATDKQTSAAGLSYNLRVGTTPGGSDVFSTMASTTDGIRHLPDAGPIQGTSYILKKLSSNTTYYWSVQAIDTAFAGSAFAPEQTASIPPFSDLSARGMPGLGFSSVAWGDCDNDGDLDVLLAGSNDGVRLAKIYRNDGQSTFTDLSVGLPGVDRGSVAWGDYDNDGDLDVLLTGSSITGRIAKVYRNNGNSTFTDVNAGLAGVGYSSAAWGDVENDGDLDILLTGLDNAGSRIAKIYRNYGNGTFADLNAGLTGVHNGSVAWGDADSDGDLDIVLTGSSGSGGIAKVYRNNGDSTFTDVNAVLTGVDHSAAAWGDYDNDGDLDILLTGLFNPFSYITSITKVYRNDGNNTFTNLNAGLTGVDFSSATWGDADNDGDLDILLTGFDEVTYTSTAKIYRNNGNGTFTDMNAGLTGVINCSAAWGDYDNDGDLDILLTGRNSGRTPIAKVYRNNNVIKNSRPAAPTNLSVTTSDTSLLFSWDPPADAQTHAGGLSYNLRVGTTPGGGNIFSTMASTASGIRRLPDAGPIQGTNFTLKSLSPSTTYYWSAQAIDTSFSGGNFSSEQVATTNTTPTIGGAVVNQAVNDTTTIAPFAGLAVTDPDNQNMFAKVTILNGVVRGDFTPTSASGWTRTVTGNNIIYSRFYHPAANIGGVVQAAIRAFVFQPRSNAIKPSTTELTDISVFINDGVANTASTTRLTTTSVNNAPVIGGANHSVRVNDDATVNPFVTLTVTDPDRQETLASVTILNGVVRGDFINEAAAGWTVRQILGNNITYKRYFSPGPNVGATIQAALRALTFRPRPNAIPPGTTELIDFQVTIRDGVAPAVADSGTRVTTTSVNNVPAIIGAVANQPINDNQTKAVFSKLIVIDPDTQDQFARVTIDSGTSHGDFTAGSTVGWTRKVTATDIIYERYFPAVENIGGGVQYAIHALAFQPRTNVPVGGTETTSFTVFVTDGLSNAKNNTTSVITTGVAPRHASAAAVTGPTKPAIFTLDIPTIVIPSTKRPARGGFISLI